MKSEHKKKKKKKDIPSLRFIEYNEIPCDRSGEAKHRCERMKNPEIHVSMGIYFRFEKILGSFGHTKVGQSISYRLEIDRN